ncbi:MAG: TonB-dependent receptor plug domain-containing protein [Bacteroidia bacterium]|nr:TonB-dependent receptor plug domain-containing protein [Bacteroidia bacterium]NNF31102.1 TonB-dependent receptor plug domain-containing protein [Flavobacteriaceae bacterium]NNK55564.1 TonB-dependent receptor plug domain-containing protein [Flavobacteriaceae bacterium]NNM08854.1 TonB-dependent receptor plug domain-containing protein [Flavobacteriaceae bacterium]
MTKIGKFTFLFILLNFNFLWGQSGNNKQSLQEVFTYLESTYQCTFTYKDIDLRYHYTTPPQASDLESTLEVLSKATLFNFTLLADRTIAVSKKQNLIGRCVYITSEFGIPFKDVAVVTPYQQVVTDNEGRADFELANSSETITIQYTGYQALTTTAENLTTNDCSSFSLLRKVEFLNTVTLVNYLAKGITKNVNGSLNVNYEEFDILPGLIEPDVLQTIQALPGIQSVNETVSFINIRGGTNDQNLILWDGIKMYQSGHFFGLISAFNPFLTSEVNIIKNGSSSEYGDGVSGIISMQGDDAVNTEIKGGWGINAISTDAFVDIPLSAKASLQLAGRKSFNNLVETPTYTEYFDKAFQNTEVVSNSAAQSSSNDDFTFYDTHLRFVYQPSDKDFLRANFLLLGNQLDFLENAEVDNELQSRQSELTQENISGGLFYRRNWSELFSTDFQLYGSTYALSATNFDILNNQRLLQNNDVLEAGIKARAFYQMSSNSVIMAGYQFNETGITNFEQINNPFFERTDKQVLRTNSIFTEATFSPTNWNTTLIGGVRFNHISKFNEVLIEPRLSINYRFLKYFSLDIAGELKSQTTSQIIDLQNDFLGVENRRWVLSRENEIPILKGQQLSAGINYSRSGWLVNAEPYIKHIKGITTQSQGFQNQLENVRTHGSYTVRGVDLLINKRFKKVNTWFSYSYAENDYTFESLTPSSFPNNIDIRHAVTYGINYYVNDFKLSGGFNWHSGKPITRLIQENQIVDGQLNFDLPNASNIDDYIRVDISGTYSFQLTEKLNAFAGISFWNLLDTRNELNSFYRINNDGEHEKVTENSLAFTPNATFRISF